jgi:hypothetical protein
MRPAITICGGLLLLALIARESPACDSAQRPRPQSILRFYNSDSFGQLGVKGLGDNLHILDQYQCYDLSFLRKKRLSLYFNNALQSDETEPTYVGAIVVRTFVGKEHKEGPYSAYLYRNSSTKKSSVSKWAHRIDVQDTVDRDSWGAANSFSILNDKYDPDRPLGAPSLADLLRQMQISTSQAVEQLRQWHALVVTPESGGFRVHHNSAQSDNQWHIGLSGSAADGGYLIARNYLIKYQPSPNPTPDVFFQVGAQDADCVYIKLVAPGDALSTFALRREGASSNVMTLKMNENAACRGLD